MAAMPTTVAGGLCIGSVVTLGDMEDDALDGIPGQLIAFSEGEQLCTVMLITGAEVQAPVAKVEMPKEFKRPGLGGGSDSFDILVGPKTSEDLMGEEIARCLFEKGFCVMKTCQKAEEVNTVVEAMRERAYNGKLKRFPEEVEPGYLGEGGRGKVAWLDPNDPEAPKEDLLEQNDLFISTIASLIQPYCTDVLGKQIDERTPALMSLSLTEDEAPEYPPEDPDDVSLGQYLSTWRRSLLQVVHVMGPAIAEMTLMSKTDFMTPSKVDSVDIEATANTIVIYRTDAFTYSVSNDEETLSLSASFLAQSGHFVMDKWEGTADWLIEKGPPGPEGGTVDVVNTATRLMANWDESEGYEAGLYSSCDSGVEIPLKRWDFNQYWGPETETLQPWQSPSKHQSFVEGVELFDHKYFEIQLKEAQGMDPLHRLCCEVAAQNLWKMGITKKMTNRTSYHGGVSVGLDKDDWDARMNDEEKGDSAGLGGGSNNQAILSNRIGFTFNLKGGNYVADTACSAALTATHLGVLPLKDRSVDKLEFHIGMGVHLCLHPAPFLGGRGNTMNSAIGRCLTFNATASGYMRGDGCSGMALKYSPPIEERCAVWRASQLGQNGRSATLTAPNGLAQQFIIENAMKAAGMTPPESTVWSCHGTGTSLGDPIEVGAVRRVQIKEPRSSALLVLTNKTHTGHLEGGAAMTSLIAAVIQVAAGVGLGILHARVLNPNLEASQFDGQFTPEMNACNATQGHAHVSSFGFGGTNGHVIFWSKSKRHTPDVNAAVIKAISQRPAPEVRISGTDPAEWEWDGPDAEIRAGDTYKITINKEDPEDAPIKWVKEEEAPEPDDGEDDFYCITGLFNDWDTDRLEDGPVKGLRTINLQVPEDGTLAFRFLLNGDEDQVLYPAVDKCMRKSMPVLGPSKADDSKAKNTWLVEAEPGSEIKIDLFVCRGLRGITWGPMTSFE